MLKRNCIAFTVIIILVFSCFAFAQEPDIDKETESMVPELINFHEVIYPMWHTAYPEKNIEMLRGFVPEINRHVQNIIQAGLHSY